MYISSVPFLYTTTMFGFSISFPSAPITLIPYSFAVPSYTNDSGSISSIVGVAFVISKLTVVLLFASSITVSKYVPLVVKSQFS